MMEPSGQIDILATHTVPSEGIKTGRIVDTKKVSACIKEASVALRKRHGIRVRRVYVNINSPDLRAKECVRKVSFDKDSKTKRFHIEELINSAIFSDVSLNRKVVLSGIFPEERNANAVNFNIVIISALIPTINSFVKCIRGAGLILEDIVPSSYAQASGLFRDSKLHPSMQRRGLDIERNRVLIDIGAGLLKITLFKNKLAKDIVILPVGAQSITEEIAMKLKVSFDCAEELKTKYGRAFGEQGHFHQKIIVKDKQAKKVIRLNELHKIISSKVDYILQEAKKAILELNRKDEEILEITFTGGGSILEGFLERAEKILGKKVKMGSLFAVKDNLIQAQSALYATSIGLIRFGFNKRNNKTFSARVKSDSFRRMLNRVKLLYGEYF